MAFRDSEEKSVQTLESGDIYFFYRPRVERHEPESAEDVQNLYVVLSPEGKKSYRLAIIGRQRLPSPQVSGKERSWGFISAVERSPRALASELEEQTYETKTRGERHLPAARPAGEGVYRILRHDGHTHLVYVLELPREPGEVQQELGIAEEASFVVSVKNPEAPTPPRAGLPREAAAEYPKKLQEVFRGRKFADVDPPELLDHEGAQFVLIAASEDVKEELGIELEAERETESTAEVFRDLRLHKSKHPVAPLLEGEWA